MASKAAKFSGRSSTSRILTLSLGPSGPSGLFQDCFSKDIDSSIQANSHFNTTSYCVGHLGNIAELRRQIAGHEIHVVRQSFQVPPTPFTWA